MEVHQKVGWLVGSVAVQLRVAGEASGLCVSVYFLLCTKQKKDNGGNERKVIK